MPGKDVHWPFPKKRKEPEEKTDDNDKDESDEKKDLTND